MARINFEQLHTDIIHAGEYGNTATATATLNVDGSSGDTAHFIRLPAHTRLLDLMVVHGACGSGASASFGYMTENDTEATYFTGSKSLASAGRIRADSNHAPKVVEEVCDIIASLGAGVDGEITVVATYDWQGK